MRVAVLAAAFQFFVIAAVPASGHAARARTARKPSAAARGVIRPAGQDSIESQAGSVGDPAGEARRVLLRAVRAAGGAQAYEAARGVSFRMITSDYKAGEPFRSDTTRVRFRLHGADRYVEEAPGGTMVGYDGNRGWGWRGGGLSLTPQDSAVGRFQSRWVPFWIELPFRFLDPRMHPRYAGSVGLDREMPTGMRIKINREPDKKVNPSRGTVFFDVVYISEGDSAHPGDEFFAFFERKTGRFRGCNFTIKEAGMKSFQWCSWLDDFVKVGGLEVARTQTFYRLATDNMPDFSEDRSGVVRVYRKLDPALEASLPEEIFHPPAQRGR